MEGVKVIVLSVLAAVFTLGTHISDHENEKIKAERNSSRTPSRMSFTEKRHSSWLTKRYEAYVKCEWVDSGYYNIRQG